MSVHHHRIRTALLAGTAAVAIGVVGGAGTAQAAVPCVVGPGVTQTDTTVVGSANNDTIDCGGASPGKTITGGPGNDTITGTASDDVISGGDGGLNTDTCHRPAPDPDIHASCENTLSPPSTGPGSGTSTAGELCTSSGGLFVDLSPVAYNCVLLDLTTDQRRKEASRICTKANAGRFVNISPLEYSCVLPKKKA